MPCKDQDPSYGTATHSGLLSEPKLSIPLLQGHLLPSLVEPQLTPCPHPQPVYAPSWGDALFSRYLANAHTQHPPQQLAPAQPRQNLHAPRTPLRPSLHHAFIRVSTRLSWPPLATSPVMPSLTPPSQVTCTLGNFPHTDRPRSVGALVHLTPLGSPPLGVSHRARDGEALMDVERVR